MNLSLKSILTKTVNIPTVIVGGGHAGVNRKCHQSGSS